MSLHIIEPKWAWSSGLSKRQSTKHIVLHHAAAKTCTAADIDRWHKDNGWSGIGYHYFIRKDGSIYRGRPEDTQGAHVLHHNADTIGICAEGDYDKEQTMPQAQYSAILSLIADIRTRYPDTDIVGHREIGSSDCPGRYYPLQSIKDDAERGDIDMTTAETLQQQITALQQQTAAQTEIIQALRSIVETMQGETTGRMIYNYIDSNMPEWARPAVQWAVGQGIVQGTGEGLGLDDRDLRYIVMMYRLTNGE